jgi:hypothetical protein
MHYKAFSAQFKTLSDEQGIFEAIVAVFGNVDRVGDKIMPGAFKGTLERWRQKGRPIPVIFSHEWTNLDAHIGEVAEAKETEEGLYVKAQLDMEEDFARRVWKRMKRGTLAEFSFAYDVIEGKEADGVYELHELELIEVGPCLVGMNPDTPLLDVKTGRRHTAKEYGQIQQIHDLACDLGAKCAEADDSANDDEGDDDAEADNGKASGQPSVIQARVAIMFLE